MSDQPLTVDQIRTAIASYEAVLASTKVEIIAADTDETVDLAGMIELLRTRDTLVDIIARLTDLAHDLTAEPTLVVLAA